MKSKANTHSEENKNPNPQLDPLTPDWEKECIICGSKPIVPITGMCGPCTFGEAKTAGGNW